MNQEELVQEAKKLKDIKEQLTILKETIVYEMSWDDYLEWYPLDSEIEDVLKRTIPLSDDWYLEEVYPRQPFERLGWKGWIRFTFSKGEQRWDY